MSQCEGLHCPGCGGHGGGRVITVAAVVVTAVVAVEWLAARLWWLIGTTVLIAAVTLGAVLWLMRWTVRREAAFAALHAAEAAAELPRQHRAAIEGGVHIHLHGLDAAEQAEVIRRAIDGRH